MRFERGAGILLHPTSLPGRFGIGDLGPEAFNFVNFLKDAGQSLWQILPLGPTGYGDSPYQCFSAFAGNPLLISPEKLREQGLLEEEDLREPGIPGPHRVDFGSVIKYKTGLLKKAYSAFGKKGGGIAEAYEKFEAENSSWLDDYSLFMALKDYYSGAPWNKWEPALIKREKETLDKWRDNLFDQTGYHKFIQFIFFEQWSALKDYANEKGIKIIGDAPIFIAYDSADLWANRELFTVNTSGELESVAGVPPDYFSETGQLWGNPLYRWDIMESNDFLWWKERIGSLLRSVDIIRLDHFRGFESYWEVPGNAKNAVNGKWKKAPGEKLFNSLNKKFGSLPFIAEDLGVITDRVEELRNSFGFPGMKILQFAFGKGMESKFLPHNFVPGCCVYTGSHDNDTTRAFFEKAKVDRKDVFLHAVNYLQCEGKNITLELIRAAYSSVADTVIIPMQDILNLGGEARMNFPSRPSGNWTWRFTWDQVDEGLAAHYNKLAELYERSAANSTKSQD